MGFMGGGFKEPVVFDVKVNDRDAQTSFKQINGQLGQMDGHATKAAQGVSKTEKAFNTAKRAATGFAVVGLGAVVVGMKQSVMLASSVAESTSKVGVVFGQYASEVVKASQTSATAMGLSKNAYLEAAGSLGNLLVSLKITPGAAKDMSMSMVKLASDFASFNNIDTAEALVAIRSGLVGETEPLRKLGVNMNEATLKAEALRMGLIKTTKEAMDPQTKALAAQALIFAQSGTAQGDFTRTSAGLANQQRILGAQIEDTKTKLGEQLIPVVLKITTAFNKFVGEIQSGTGTGGKFKDTAISMYNAIKPFVMFFVNNGKALMDVFTIIGGGVIVFKTLTKAVALADAAMWLYRSSMTALMVPAVATAGATTAVGVAGTAAGVGTTAAAGGIRLMTAAMVANPIMVWAVALTAVATAAWKVYRALDKVNDANAKYAKEYGKKVDTSKIAGSFGGKGSSGMGHSQTRAEIDAIRAERIANLPTRGGASSMPSKINPKYVAARPKTDDELAGGGGGGGGGGKKDDAKKKKADELAKLWKNVKSSYSSMNKIIAEHEVKRQEIIAEADERVADAHKDWADRKFIMERDNEQAMTKLNETNRRAEAKLRDTARLAELAAEKNYDDAIEDEKKKNFAVLAGLTEAYNEKVANLNKAASEKQASIIQKSMDLLTGAFASATKVDVGDMFEKSTTGLAGVLDGLKTQLSGAKTLAANAAKLAGAGFSQNFIQSVVSKGAGVGNSMADAILTSSPASISELQSLYKEIDAVSETGVDNLAKTMNSGMSLANRALMAEYANVGVELSNSLAQASADLSDAEAKQMTAFNAANATHLATLTEARLSIKKTLDDGLAEQALSYADAIAEMKVNTDNEIWASKKTLDDAIAASQIQFEKDIKALVKSSTDSLTELQDKLAETAAAIKALSGIKAGVGVLANSPGAGYVAGTKGFNTDTANTNPQVGNGADAAYDRWLIQQNITVQNPVDSVQEAINASRFGTLVKSGSK